jgi:4-amino-4-deoxy-L-arabinose transferase-like glycosyltransferase
MRMRSALMRRTLVARTTIDRISIAIIAVAIVAGVALRVYSLGTVPLGLHPDEACDGYDAYSLWMTGRDHHGNFLPLAMQGFNDYRMPLFQYSIVPLVAAFGLKTSVVRFGAALWGIADLLAVTAIAALMLGLPGAAAASLLYALSPWQLAFSRHGQELSAASATVSLAMLAFFMWLRFRKDRWLFASAILFGLSLYAYSLNKAVTPLLIAMLAMVYQEEIRAAAKPAMIAVAIVVALAAPQAILFVTHSAEMGARFGQTSIASYKCPTCNEPSMLEDLENMSGSLLGYFTPSFLFVDGDRGDHWTLLHPPGFGQLLPEQAILVALGLLALRASRRKATTPSTRSKRGGSRARHRVEIRPRRERGRKDFAIVVVAWLILGVVPAALVIPLAAFQPEPGKLIPTAWLLIEHSLPSVPLTPSLLMSHPDSRHALFEMVPWTLLSALGLVTLLEMEAVRFSLRVAAAGLLLCGIVFHAAKFARFYFGEYPTLAAPYFQYGLERVVDAIAPSAASGDPIVLTARINQPYIYVLFYEGYSPAEFQRNPVWQPNRLFGPVLRFSNYVFVLPGEAYPAIARGTFVFSSKEDLPAAPQESIDYPDGQLAFSILRK